MDDHTSPSAPLAVPGSSRQRLQRRPMSSFVSRHSQITEKEPDDLSTPEEPRRPHWRSAASTRNAISQLFTRQASTSPPSRQPSYIDQSRQSMLSSRTAGTETASLEDHLHKRGLLEGRHADITVIAFDSRYPLHRLILDRAPFFASALTPPWLEASATEIVLHPEGADSNITQRTFEVALHRLYGNHDPIDRNIDPFAMLATACWLQMQDLIDESVDAILASLRLPSLGSAISRVTSNCYGAAGSKISAFAQCLLIKEGIDASLTFFDDLPADIIRDIVSNDGFYVRDEFDRWSFARRLLDRRLRAVSASLNLPTKSAGKAPKAPQRLRRFQGRLRSFNGSVAESDSDEEPSDEHKVWIELYSNPEVEPILNLLDHGIYYMHLTFEQLQSIRRARDVFGFPVVPERRISTALWDGLEFRQKVVNARPKDESLGLIEFEDDQPHATTFLELNNSPLISSPDTFPLFSTITPNTEAEQSRSASPSTKYYIPVDDSTLPIGRNPFDAATRHSRSGPLSDNRDFVHDDWGPSQRQSYVANEEIQGNPYSMVPPFRFGVQFDKPQNLPEKRRVYSQIFFYAGSYWNIYIQKLAPSSRTKRTPRLGFYLHRTKGPDVESPGGSGLNFVDGRISALEQGLLRTDVHGTPSYGTTTENRTYGAENSSSGEDMATQQVRAAMQTLMARPNRISEYQGSPNSSPQEEETSFLDSHGHASSRNSHSRSQKPMTPAIPPYVDTRTTVRAYFKIHTITPNGRHMSVHQSRPDKFTFSQSWGWKSSTIMAEDEWTGAEHSAAAFTIPGSTTFQSTLGGHWTAGSDEEVGGVSQKMAKLEVDVGGELDTDKEKDLESGGGSEGKLRFMVTVGLV